MMLTYKLDGLDGLDGLIPLTLYMGNLSGDCTFNPSNPTIYTGISQVHFKNTIKTPHFLWKKLT